LAILVILILAILWAAVLLPPILRSRNESGAPSGVGDFMSRLGSFGRSQQGDQGLPALTPIMGPVNGGFNGNGNGNGNGHGPVANGAGAPTGAVRVPGGMTPQQRRRRDVFVGLLALAGVTFFMALFARSIPFWILHLIADGLLGGYVYMLVQMKHRSSERRTKVHAIHPPMGPAVPVFSEAHVDAPRDAQVLVLRKTGSY
jgi:hypothetical protein